MKSFYGGQKYILTVQEYEAQVMDWSRMPDTGLEHPSHYVAMSYTITPELLDGTLDIAAATKATGRGRHPLRPGNPLLPHAPWWWESSAVQMAPRPLFMISKNRGSFMRLVPLCILSLLIGWSGESFFMKSRLTIPQLTCCPNAGSATH